MSGTPDSVTLDDLYYMVAHIYSERNADRSRTDTFAHFVEVCSLLTSWQTFKPRGDVDIETALCKALGWYFPLAAKLRIQSLQSVILRKYPGVCPYCQEVPHNTDKCDSDQKPNFEQLKERFSKMTAPRSLNTWQEMFRQIYPRERQARKSLLGLFEELGELAEALRFYDRYPNYALGEMADVFSYIMGLANEYRASENKAFDFQDRFLREYPAACPTCRHAVCDCVGLPEHARVAKELPIQVATDLLPHPQSLLERRTTEVTERIARSVASPALARRIRRTTRPSEVRDVATGHRLLGDLAGIDDARWDTTDPKELLGEQWALPLVVGLDRIVRAENKQEWGTAIDQLNEVAHALLFRAIEVAGAGIGVKQDDIEAAATNALDYGAVVIRQHLLQTWRWVGHLTSLYGLRSEHIAKRATVEPPTEPTSADWDVAQRLFEHGVGKCCKLILGVIQGAADHA